MMAKSAQAAIRPVLLCGGAGSRLWPLSRELYPKQYLPLCSERSMLQDTALRVEAGDRFAAPLVVCNQDHRFIVAEQLRQGGVKPAGIILEPVGRNTAAACAVAALEMAEADPDSLMLVLPADHAVTDVPAFLDAVDVARRAASVGYLVTFGVQPTGPETGYGYIRRGAALSGVPGAFRVQEFVEKPPRATAERYVAGGEHAWNSGMFLFSAGQFVAELERHAPAVLAAARRALEKGSTDLEFLRLDADAFTACPAVSIDTAVMEKTDSAAVVPGEFGWTDVGAWSALWEVGAKDKRGNVAIGDVITEDSDRCYVRSDGALTAVVGLNDAVVVVTDDAVLVSSKDKVQQVKTVVERLRRDGRTEAVSHRRVHRPWGSYQSVHNGDRFQVKCLVVNPGNRLSLQRHHHRAEHWVVVQGTALVTRGEEQSMVYENESVYIPIGAVHRLENPGKVPLHIIEVQSGSYLGEDDIVRLEDVYGRVKA
ncbi:mannose-1-phosphate guanylyltransferase/mannose-6-phosphate isomerase [Azospirillum sp. RWY-5-1]|uniref:mannose-1-phosphate guanylyltransferase n=1 Tax=Azospirillum oleiclasticum TaxID=2735135 RepID=A0ABX2TIB2_9PROT|nr:mannose-1-phosphate guanylyltransferase/mannose-6-phosphate isomerase [Azospirillum oleiclasticum]NYZ16588.1 mannose-1-phosphate guanylyltransferase/mannose-6-phosphate isomerase [Azospirillum oleiclasticum]NYZ24075.1 mannose-1-phosphate guanylyltransferase/mannose-6-phosphate isomerase [Azospirillum oleiclasticum]